MSYKDKRFVTAYCFLVILPVLGIVEVLDNGRGMSAPPSVDGTWKLEANAGELAALLCGKSTPAIEESFITISQSGKNLVLELKSNVVASGMGVIDGNNIKASLLLSPAGLNQISCPGGRVLTLNGTLDSRAGARSLAGRLSVEACPNCMPLAFHARGQAHQLGEGAH